jgi:hypothetical protein
MPPQAAADRLSYSMVHPREEDLEDTKLTDIIHVVLSKEKYHISLPKVQRVRVPRGAGCCPVLP